MVAEAASLTISSDAVGRADAAGPRVRLEARAMSASFESVYAEHARFIWRVLRGMGVPDAAIEDAVQEVFIVVHRRLPEFDGRHALRTWLFAIAYRVACDQRRKHRRASTIEPIGENVLDAALTPQERVEQSQRLQVLSAALDTLDDDKRALIVLAELEELTVPEIAALTDTSVNTVYTRLRRARIELHAVLKKGGGR